MPARIASKRNNRDIVTGMRRNALLILLFLLIAHPVTAEQKWDPVADPKAVVIEGAARFTILMERPQGKRQDLYLFAYGHDYKQALYDYTLVAGKIPLPPRFAFGTWWSRYWAYTDTEFEELVRGFQEHDIPLDVLVIDMDWHPTFGVKWWENRKDQSGHTLGWTGYTWHRTYFPDPGKFLDWVHRQELNQTPNMHPDSWLQ